MPLGQRHAAGAVRVGYGAELQQLKRAAMTSRPGLTQQHRRAERAPHRKRDQQEERPEHDQTPHRAEHVDGALGRPAQRRHLQSHGAQHCGLGAQVDAVSASACQRARLANMQTATACLAHTMSAPDRLRELLNEGA